MDLRDKPVFERTCSDVCPPTDTAERCRHGIRYPHECDDCANTATDEEIATFMANEYPDHDACASQEEYDPWQASLGRKPLTPQRGRTRFWRKGRPGGLFPTRQEACWGEPPFMWEGMCGWYKRYCLTPGWRHGFVPYQTATLNPCKNSCLRGKRGTRATLIVVLGAVPFWPCKHSHPQKEKRVEMRTVSNYCGWVSSACSGCIAELIEKGR